ncbi:hypothetical protein NL108_016889 [Boleophthalmus pectinirostris]|uniref:CMP-N-acetylneuraminate-beta-galactosamide- alpha-2,3-sialyltransferase 1-like n=1 Tax=Boleophthalmus pectinirostris TaxID=150288 RepID=UPI00242A765A|nr:CMP-N-acetylneuraminate-beta-galactosamide-alpha-2,3-sialyltransferase 1-like [Boleophthalmus pectinirostris]XP_055013530.1 CMP-N-acetylneuraminate-beta-galactosamide-alpha-2,3-sialyltransferase 1-like [Boleophthalmus pectinirostris]KAJ0055399.1 hypothetical protein NL108_016889 [Boleophthalmus pectinirostris]
MNTSVKGIVFVVLLGICGICGIYNLWEMPDMTSWGLNFMEKYKEIDCEKRIVNQQDEQWFLRHFQKSIPPFLSRNYNVSQEAFSWWTKLQANPKNFDLKLFSETTQKIFEGIPAHPPVAETNPDHCRTCAVVGNSVNLKRSHYGKLIDQHESVFRINLGMTNGFEKDVGTKTTHRVIYPESMGARLDNTTHLVFFPFKLKDLNWLAYWVTPGTVRVNNPIKRKDLVLMANPAFMRYIHLSWLQGKGQYSSTGFMTVILALHICDEVSVFGFGADSDGNWSHYWEPLYDKHLRTGPHPGSLELNLIEELARRGKLVFYRGF